MTLVIKLDLDIIKIYVHTKIKSLNSVVQKLKTKQIDRHIDRVDLNYYLPAHADGNQYHVHILLKTSILNWHFTSPIKYIRSKL